MLCCAKSAGVVCRPEQTASDEAKRVTIAYVALRTREGETELAEIEKSRKAKDNSGESLVLPVWRASVICSERETQEEPGEKLGSTVSLRETGVASRPRMRSGDTGAK